MRRWILAGAIMALLTVVALAGCRAPVYVMRVEAQSGVRWDGYYGVARKAVNGAVHDKLRISGNGGWELALPQDAGVIQGLVLSVTKQGQNGVLRVLILRGDRVMAEDAASGPYEGASCTWGSPP